MIILPSTSGFTIRFRFTKFWIHIWQTRSTALRGIGIQCRTRIFHDTITVTPLRNWTVLWTFRFLIIGIILVRSLILYALTIGLTLLLVDIPELGRTAFLGRFIIRCRWIIVLGTTFIFGIIWWFAILALFRVEWTRDVCRVAVCYRSVCVRGGVGWRRENKMFV